MQTETTSWWTWLEDTAASAKSWIVKQATSALEWVCGAANAVADKLREARQWSADTSVDMERSAVVRWAASALYGNILLAEAGIELASHAVAIVAAVLYGIFYSVPRALWKRLRPVPLPVPV